MDMWELADRLGLAVTEGPREHRSGYYPDEKVVHLRPGMIGRVARSVLAHEIGHHVLGHLPVLHGPVRAKQERTANEWAALQLIDADACAAAERANDGLTALMAVDLQVSEKLVVVYQSMISRIGDVAYVRARHGAGQWAHRLQTA